MSKTASLGFETIEVVPLHEQVYQTLTRSLMSGHIPPGRKLTTRFEGVLSSMLEIDYHDEVAAALADRDGKAAAEAMRRDIGEGAEYLLEHKTFDEDMAT